MGLLHVEEDSKREMQTLEPAGFGSVYQLTKC